jgi:hypothetical protein
MLKLVEIAKAWIIEMDPTEEQQKIAEERLTICQGCDSLKQEQNTGVYYCGICYCPIKKKIYSPLPGKDVCPLAKWKD